MADCPGCRTADEAWAWVDDLLMAALLYRDDDAARLIPDAIDHALRAHRR